uniref:Reverse transcriptase n=1 Tax=Angiostrongylus cantonensis TaxID=6313 RepID=A0A0K0D621_ANGCA
MEAAWIKNYGDDLYQQRTYTRIRVLDRGLAHANKNDKVRRHRPGRDETVPPIQLRLCLWRRIVPRNMRQ